MRLKGITIDSLLCLFMVLVFVMSSYGAKGPVCIFHFEKGLDAGKIKPLKKPSVFYVAGIKGKGVYFKCFLATEALVVPG
jgi:hypothetical protein